MGNTIYTGGGALMSALIITLCIGPKVIKLIKSHQGQQPIRNDGPESHLKKAGTPTMGGAMILPPLTLATFAFVGVSYITILLLALMWAYAFVGFADDWSKVKKNTHKGLSGKVRLLLEAITASVFVGALLHKGHAPELLIPFTNVSLEIGIIGYFLLSVFAIVGTSNAVNLTDGLDGLAIVPIALVAVFFNVVASGIVGPMFFMHDIYILTATIVGAGIGFLWFNTNPARIFMGDFGSLSLGALLAGIAVVLNLHLFLIIVGALFVIETLSVMIQVVSYKSRKKRVFKMAPIHHHFELSGWSENQVIVRAWIFSFVMLLLGILSLGELV